MVMTPTLEHEPTAQKGCNSGSGASRYSSVFRYAMSSAICWSERIPAQCGMLTIGARPNRVHAHGRG